MRSVRMYLLRLDGELHASATYMKTRSRTVSMSSSRSEIKRVTRSFENGRDRYPHNNGRGGKRL